MMWRFVLLLVLSIVPFSSLFAQPGDGSTRSMKTLRFNLSADWVNLGGGGTQTFRSEKLVEKASDSYVIVDVSVHNPKGRNGATCLDEIVNFAGGDWERNSDENESRALQVGKDENGSIVRVSSLGCNRDTTWSLVFFTKKPNQISLLNIAKEATKSVVYVRPL